MVSINNGIDNKVGASNSGNTNTFTITNPSNTASSAARETVIVGGGSAADPTLNFNVSGVTNWEMGIDNSDSDKFKLAQGTALGTNDTFIMTTTGSRTMPLQPAFLATISSTIPNVTGDSTTYTLIFDHVVFDRQSNYNNATGIFTAPVTGVYFITSNINFTGLGAANGSGIAIININNGTLNINGNTGNPFNQANASGQLNWLAVTQINLTAGDTVKITTTIGGGAKNVSIIANLYPNFYQNTFSIGLLF